MSFSDYSTTPGANTTVGGVNVGENCPPANVNNAIRQLAADGKELSDAVDALDAGMPVAGGTFTGNITRQGAGGYLYNAGAAQTGGKVYFLPEGTALPSLAEGDVVFFYT